MQQTSNDIYRTSETAIAAYLIAIGYDYPSIEYENGYRAYFVFKAREDLDDKLNQWDTQRAEGNLVRFFNAYQNLIRRIKER